MNCLLNRCLIGLMFMIAGCGSSGEISPRVASMESASGQNASVRAPDFKRDYRLSIGDNLYIRVEGEDAYSGAVPVGDDGIIAHPQLGRLQTLGLSIADLEKVIEERLRDADVGARGVEISVLNLRAIYIIGEVEESGEFPYFEGLRVQEAIERAGGFTYKADQKRVFVTRFSHSTETEISISSIVLPGDIIRVPQRYF